MKFGIDTDMMVNYNNIDNIPGGGILKQEQNATQKRGSYAL
jgi:hypothetical protein